MTKSTKKTSTPKPRNIPGISFLRDRYIGFLAAVFFITRIGCWLAGVRFDAYVNVHLMHFVPSALLREHLWASVIHLHNQPPLFNLFLGIVYTLFPGSSSVVFHTIYLVLGLTLTLSLYSVMTRLGVMKKLAAALTVLFIASPACILYENLLLYCYPVTVMLCLGVLFLVRFLEKGCTLDLLCFFCLTAAVVLTRSMYHLVWFAVFPVLLIVFRRNEWKRILAAALIPFMAVFLLYAKNLYLFGGFNGSSWMGMSLSKLTTMRVPEKDRIELMRRGKLSELSLIPPFKALWQYGEYGDIPEFKATGVQVLDTVFYPDIGNNWNNAAYLAISKQYLKDALYVLRTMPGVYVKGVAESFKLFFFPSSDWFHQYASVKNVEKIGYFERVYNRCIEGQFFGSIAPGIDHVIDPGYFGSARNIGFFILVIYIVSCGYGLRLLFLVMSGKRKVSAGFIAVAAMMVTIVYATCAGNLLEVGENYRFRFDIDPLLIVLFGMFLNDCAGRYISARRHDGNAGRER